MLFTLPFLLAALPFLSPSTASPTPIHSIASPKLSHVIRTAFPPTLDKPECLRKAYYGAYGGRKGGQDHIYMPDIDCLTSLGEYEDKYEPGTRVYRQEEREGKLGWEYQSVMAAYMGELDVWWVGPAGMEPALLAGVIQSEGIDGKRASNGLVMMNGQPDVVPLLDAERATTTHAQHANQAEAGLIRDALWSIAHSYLPDRYISTMHKFDAITVHPISSSSHLIIMPKLAYLAGNIDRALPVHLVPVALPSTALSPSQYSDTEEAGDASAFAVPVPKERADYLRNITQHLTFDPKLDRAIEEGLDGDQLRRDIRWLTGEAPSGWESRHSFTQGARDAAHWIKDQVESTNAGAKCHLEPFLPGFSPNVICHYPSSASSSSSSFSSSLHYNVSTARHVIFSAHYDSRGSFGQTAAPGGDDDGSGSGHLLAIARAIGKLGARFEKDVVLAWFAGEEQGLLGSRAFAEKLYQQNATVLLQVQADMLGYHVPGEPLQLGLPETIALPEASALLSTLANLYAPELVVGTTAACCSDHQSFLSLGFPSTQVFERNGWIADPMYHNSGDVSDREGYDFEQVRSVGKVTMAGLMSVAGWRIG